MAGQEPTVGVGSAVCACDLTHGVVVAVCVDDPDMAVLADGRTFSISACLEPAKEDGSCHGPWAG